MMQVAAHRRVAAALRSGSLVRGECEIGGNCKGIIVAHHDDYDLPLDVHWLCVRHHNQHHAALRRAEREANVGPAIRQLRVAALKKTIRERLIRLLVERARREGKTWEQIGQALGVTRQAAQQQYGRVRVIGGNQ